MSCSPTPHALRHKEIIFIKYVSQFVSANMFKKKKVLIIMWNSWNLVSKLVFRQEQILRGVP